MRYKILAVFLLVCGLTSCKENRETHFEGVYQCKGFDPYLNTVYSGTIAIIPYNTVYNVKMEYDTGQKAVGTAGLWSNDTIAVVFQDINDPKVIGLERYSYSKDRKEIEGYWVYLGKDKLGKEVCVKK